MSENKQLREIALASWEEVGADLITRSGVEMFLFLLAAEILREVPGIDVEKQPKEILISSLEYAVNLSTIDLNPYFQKTSVDDLETIQSLTTHMLNLIENREMSQHFARP